MSKIYSNFKRRECGLCEYYSAKREVHRGMFLGNDIRVSEEKAICSRTGKETRCTSFCSHFSQCGQASSLQMEIENRKAQANLRRENEKAQAEIKKQQQQMEDEARKLRYERYRLEEENRIAAMTPSQKRAYYAKIQREEAARKRLLEQEAKEYEAKRKKELADRIAKFKITKIVCIVLMIIGFAMFFLLILGMISAFTGIAIFGDNLSSVLPIAIIGFVGFIILSASGIFLLFKWKKIKNLK